MLLGEFKKINQLITIGYIPLEKTCNVDNLFTLNNYSKNGVRDRRIIYYLYGFSHENGVCRGKLLTDNMADTIAAFNRIFGIGGRCPPTTDQRIS